MWVLAGAAMLAAGAAQASDDDAKKLLQKSGCTACHSEDKKLVGPAYKDVAAKYKGDVGKATTVVKSKDHPEVDATDAELKKLVSHAIGAK